MNSHIYYYTLLSCFDSVQRQHFVLHFPRLHISTVLYHLSVKRLFLLLPNSFPYYIKLCISSWLMQNVQRKCTAPAQEWIMGVIMSSWICSWSCGFLPGLRCPGCKAALQFAAEEEGVVRLALSDPETLEGQCGACLSCKGWGGLWTTVFGIWSQTDRGKWE